jgi:hypothetical protein
MMRGIKAAGLVLALGALGMPIAAQEMPVAAAPAQVDAEKTDAVQTPPARATIGWGRFFNNDYIGDGKDRWRTSSYTLSQVRGPAWAGDLPSSFGTLREFRLRAENIAPASLSAPSADDRRYAGALSFGVHSHFQQGQEEISLGADMVVIGPQTGLSRLQDALHDEFGLPDGAASYDAQFPNTVKLAITGEVGRDIALGKSLTLRPFVEGQVGVETLARAGVDLTLGNLAKDSLLLRDASTGQRYSAAKGPLGKGVSLTLGGDVARVEDSFYLPSGGAVTRSPTRSRLRAGVNWQGEKSFVFFGMTHLSPEFDEQPTGQTLGSLSLLMRF